METNNNQYDQQPYDNQGYDNYGYDDYGYNQPDPNQKSVKGLKIMVLVLAVILIGLSAIFFLQMRRINADFAVERDTLTSQLSRMVADYDSLRIENDTISQNMLVARGEADSLLQKLKDERNISYRKIKDYEKRLDYMRTVMDGYIRQIDSLNTINQRLGTENVTLRHQVTSARLRADMAEERVSELDTKVQKGAVIRARNIALLALNNNDREVSRSNRAERLRVDFVLVGNELSTPGERNVYAQIQGPDGYVMANASNALFSYEGDMITYSATRQVDYQNEDLYVSLFYNGAGITAGKYTVRIFIDGHKIGENEIILR